MCVRVCGLERNGNNLPSFDDTFMFAAYDVTAPSPHVYLPPTRLPACSRRRREPGRAGQDAVRAPLRLAGGADQQKDQLAGFRSRGGRRWVVVRRLRMRYGDAVVGLWPACVCAGRLASTPTPCTLCTRPHICSLDCRWRWQRRPPGAVGRCQEALHCHPGHLRLRIVRIQLLRAALHQPGQRTPAAAVQRPCL